MKFHSVLLLLNAFLSTTTSLECYEPGFHETRTFDSIVQYQANKIPFNPLNGQWQGSIVEFNCSTINQLEKNTFITADSEAIISLKLSNKQINQIDNGAFISLHCLYHLKLDHNNISTISKETFEDLEKLRVLDLSYNKMETLNDLTFIYLNNLRILHLSNNRLKEISSYTFLNLTQLQYLNLETNRLVKFPNDLFQSLPSLQTLTLAANRLRLIELEKLTGLDKLTSFDLSGNGLDHFDPNYNYSFKLLKSFNLSSNYLTTLNVKALREHFGKLEMIDLSFNPWFCDDLHMILQELKDSKIHFVGTKVTCSDTTRFSSTSSSSTTNVFDDNNSNNDDGDNNNYNNTDTMSKEEIEKIVDDKMVKHTKGMKSSLRIVKSFVIFLFILMCIFIVLEVTFKTNLCRNFIRSVRGRGQVIDRDSEYVSLFSR